MNSVRPVVAAIATTFRSQFILFLPSWLHSVPVVTATSVLNLFLILLRSESAVARSGSEKGLAIPPESLQQIR